MLHQYSKEAATIPGMPAQKKRIPTLIIKTNFDIQEKKRRQEERGGRYSLIVPREKKQ